MGTEQEKLLDTQRILLSFYLFINASTLKSNHLALGILSKVLSLILFRGYHSKHCLIYPDIVLQPQQIILVQDCLHLPGQCLATSSKVFVLNNS